MFTKYPKYFSVFSSCNAGMRINPPKAKTFRRAGERPAFAKSSSEARWCGNCPKCLFVYATLYPYLEKEQLLKIFGGDLFENKGLLPTMEALIGKKTVKPFECVGTKKESQIAFYLSYKNYTGRTRAILPILLKYFEKKILPKYPNLKKESKIIMNGWNNQYNLPKEFEKILRKVP